MELKDVIDSLNSIFSKQKSYNNVSNIYSTDRWFDFSKFRETSLYCAEEMKKAGLEEVELLPLKADGHTAYGDWVIPKAWDVSGAVLRVESPGFQDPVIADYKDVPCSLMMYSSPTLPGGITAEVVDVDQWGEGSMPNLKGKIILTAGKPQELVNLAVRTGAIGILSDYFPLYSGIRNTRENVYSASRWENDFICPLNDTGLFGFSLSPCHGDRLRKFIKEYSQDGKAVKVHAEVDTRFYEGECFTVSGVIMGTDPKAGEVIICGHLYEPGANDNASGCGTILELAAAIQEAVCRGILEPPKRSLRFVMGFECVGLMGYFVSHRDRIGNTIGAVNLDMVGSSPEDKARLNIWHNPLSNWSFIDTLIIEIINLYSELSGIIIEYEESAFSIGDNLLADPMINVPTIAMIMHPAESYHSSIDTMERVDPDVLKQNAVIAGTLAYTMSAPDSMNLSFLLEAVIRHAEEAISRHSNGDTVKEYLISRAFHKSCMDVVSLLMENDIAQINEIEEMLSRLPVSPEPDVLMAEGHGVGDWEKLVPQRSVDGCITFFTLPMKERTGLKWSPFYNYDLNCSLFWADGVRNLWEIAVYSAAELNRGNPYEVLSELKEYYEYLNKLGYIKFI